LSSIAVEWFEEARSVFIYDWSEEADTPLRMLTQLHEFKVVGSDPRRPRGLEPMAESVLTLDQVFKVSFNDRDLSHLSELRNLRMVYLPGAAITDSGLQYITNLTRLNVLDLRNTQVGDSGLKHVGELHQLQELDLRNTHVTDAGLEHLAGIVTLKRLRAGGSGISRAGAAALRRALPKCRVERP